MKPTNYSSKDFFRVKNTLQACMPAKKLIHKQVLHSEESTGDKRFTAERDHLVRIIDLPSKVISMTLGGLNIGQAGGKHRHTYESVIYILEGKGKTVIEDHKIEWEAGDALYVPVWAWHQHFNLGNTRCLYLTAESAPLLQNLGNVALREEAVKK